jgi:predicted dienelactone hydrolase
MWSTRIDARQVAVAGFSSGGYTAIALAGGIFDPAQMDQYCESEDRGPDCELGRGVLVDRTNAMLNFRDNRIKAAIAMAPAVGPGVTEESLKAINIPVLVVAAVDDELVRPGLSAQRYADLIRGSELIVLPAGGHFVFLECGPVTAIVDLFIDFNLCGRGIDVDRTQVQEQVSDATVRFLADSLSVRENAT